MYELVQRNVSYANNLLKGMKGKGGRDFCYSGVKILRAPLSLYMGSCHQMMIQLTSSLQGAATTVAPVPRFELSAQLPLSFAHSQL